MLEKCMEYKIITHNLFMAYDNQEGPARFLALQALHINKEVNCFVKMSMHGSKHKIRIDTDLSEEFEVIRGEWQGGIFAASLNLSEEDPARNSGIQTNWTLFGKHVEFFWYEDIVVRFEQALKKAFLALETTA